METSAISSNCAWCGGLHPQTICPKVKAIDYYPDGTMKRVEFKVAADYGPPIPLGGQHSAAGFAGLPEHLQPNSNR